MEHRLATIQQARQQVLSGGARTAAGALEPWIERSWLRCLADGKQPGQRLAFDPVSQQAMRRTADANHALVRAAQPVLARLGRALATTRYFAILTDAAGAVVDVNGPIDRSDRRATLITRIGADLSEQAVGTTAIGAALAEKAPVWLHRGEHFFTDTSAYSCAGAPVFGPDGRCAGMLDLTGIDVEERPELKHLVVQSARSIENALTLARPWSLLLRLNWPGRSLGDDSDGLVGLDADGWLTGANPAAREMLARLVRPESTPAPVHGSELFAMPFETFFDTARRDTLGRMAPIEVPLWSGLRLQALPQTPARVAAAPAPARMPLKDLEISLIRQAVDDARGNVMQAARALGISRATVYRKLGRPK